MSIKGHGDEWISTCKSPLPRGRGLLGSACTSIIHLGRSADSSPCWWNWVLKFEGTNARAKRWWDPISALIKLSVTVPQQSFCRSSPATRYNPPKRGPTESEQSTTSRSWKCRESWDKRRQRHHGETGYTANYTQAPFSAEHPADNSRPKGPFHKGSTIPCRRARSAEPDGYYAFQARTIWTYRHIWPRGYRVWITSVLWSKLWLKLLLIDYTWLPTQRRQFPFIHCELQKLFNRSGIKTSL